MRVIQTETGGAFGGKEDYPQSGLPCCPAGHEERPCGQDGLRPHGGSGRDHQAPSFARAPSHRARHATASCWRWTSTSRQMAAPTPRFHPRCFRAPRCTPRTVLCPNVRVRSRSWATNTIPYGAFRGFGAPQAIFAMERHMDEIAAAIGIDPVELRRRNFLHQGDTNATEQLMREPVILDQLLDRALRRERLPCQARAICPRKSRQPGEAGHRYRRLLSRVGIYRIGRGVFEFAGRRGRHARGPGARARLEHGVWPGHEHHPHADCRGGARHRLQRSHDGGAGHQPRSQQRANCGFAHLDGRRPSD